MKRKIGVSSVDKEERYFGCGEVWGYMVAGEYVIDLLVPVVLVILKTFPESGFEVFMEYLQFSFALGIIRGGKDAINAKLLEGNIH